MSTPIVSILIPTYNSSPYIERALSSARAQTYQNVEIVIQDNASTDDTWEISSHHASRDARVRCYRNPQNLGPLRNWQNGLQQCRGHYVKILWSDDWLDPACVEECVKALESDDKAGLVFTGVIAHDRDSDFPLYLYPHRQSFDVETYLLRTIASDNMPMSPGAAMVRRCDAQFDIIETNDAQLWAAASNMGAGPDVLFLLMAAIRYERVAHVPKFYNHFQGRADSFTGANPAAVTDAYRKTLELFLHGIAKKRFSRLPQKVRHWRLMKNIWHWQSHTAARLYRKTSLLLRSLSNLRSK